MNLPATNLQPEVRFSQLLYKLHTDGKVGSWQVETLLNPDGTATNRFLTTKVLGGKSVETTNQVTKGKNVGRSNETSPLEQATFEAQSKANKKLDQGYVTEKPEAGAKVTNALGFARPMLAQPIEKVKAWDFPVHVQPKLDGHRLLATIKDGKVELYSRGGKTANIVHVSEALQRMHDEGRWDGTTLDGEIYLHGESLQAISSLVKRPQEDSAKLVYNIYDIMLDKPYWARFEILQYTLQLGDAPALDLSECHLVKTEERLNHLHSTYLAQGYEGTIVRQGNAGYEEGKRSKSLMKKKDFQDAEFKITGVSEGKPNERLKTRVAIYHCITDEGKEFTVTAPGNAQEKHEHAVNGRENIGRSLTVKFFNFTPDGIPFLPVALRVREDI